MGVKALDVLPFWVKAAAVAVAGYLVIKVAGRAAGGGGSIDIASLAYSGSSASGTLLAGMAEPVTGSLTVQVRRYVNPFTSPVAWQLAHLLGATVERYRPLIGPWEQAVAHAQAGLSPEVAPPPAEGERGGTRRRRRRGGTRRRARKSGGGA